MASLNKAHRKAASSSTNETFSIFSLEAEEASSFLGTSALIRQYGLYAQ